MMNKILKRVFVILIMLISSWAYAYALKLEPASPVEIDVEKLQEAGVGMSKRIEVVQRPNIEYRAKGLRNPFEQPVLGNETDSLDSRQSSEATLPSLVVQGVIWEGSPKQAIINNRVVKVGDVLENTDIVDISKEGVIVLFAGVEHKISTVPAMGQQVDSGK